MKSNDIKSETLNLRVSPALKTAIKLAAEREHRSIANLIEYLILDYCKKHGLISANKTNSKRNKDE